MSKLLLKMLKSSEFINKVNTFLKDERKRSLFYFICAVIALVILLLIPCPGLLIYLLILLSSIFVVVNGINVLFAYQLIHSILQKNTKYHNSFSKKYPHADIEKFRKLFLNIGLLLTLVIVISAFNWTQCETNSSMLDGLIAIPDEIEVEPPLTDQKQLPPPPLVVEIEVVSNEEILEEEIEIEESEATEEMEIEAPEEPEEPDFFVIVEKMPEFPGGQQALFKFLANVTYPQLARESGIEGIVYVQFIVDKNGSVTNVKLQRGVHPLLDKAAINRVKVMPKWKSGRQRGKAVRVQFVVPMNFKLQ